VALKAFDDLDYGALARAAGLRRADIAKAGADDLDALGFAPGGAGPFPLATAARLILDPHVVEPGTIYVGGGQPDVTVEIDPHVLVRQFRPVLAPLSRKRAT
jgi:prolyl-tRNA editing enzyme YbaK/EbsC (Cys-tRNA(Pro) deacylase)